MDGVEKDGAALEIEVKIRVTDTREARDRLARLPAILREPRAHEDNDVYDTPDRALSARRDLLRLRVAAGRAILTFKRKVDADFKAKVRQEIQTSVTTPSAMREILRALGYARIYRYEKYRAWYEWTDPESGGSLAISLDETPIGVFVELEGERGAIDRAARRMGWTESDFIVEDYRELHEEWLAERGLPEGDMVFVEPADGPGRP